MMMNAAAINNLPANVFADILKKDVLSVIDNNYVVMTREMYDTLMEEYADRKIDREAAKRLTDANTKTYTQQEIMKMFDITEKDIAAVGDVEIE